MVTRKYIKDYRLDDSLDSRGRLRAQAVYVGGDYEFSEPELTGVKWKRRIAALLALCWPCFIGALLPKSLAVRTVYCALPFSACVLPLSFASAAAALLLRAREPFRRDQADKLSTRLPTSALACAILSSAALLGFIAAAALSPDRLVWGDAVFAALAAALMVASLAVWKLSKRFKTRKREDA